MANDGAALTIDLDAVLARDRAMRAAMRTPRARDVAEAIGVPEAALIEARRREGAARPLRRPAGSDGLGALLYDIRAAGEVMALTRNAHCVHERHGVYAAPEFHGAMGQIVGEIDLRIFGRHWAHAYAVREDTRSGPRDSLQFFDAAGDAVHKIYATRATDAPAFAAVSTRWIDEDAPAPEFAPRARPFPPAPDANVDVGALREGWAGLEHSHDFHALLRRCGVTRAQAMRLAGDAFARAAGVDAARLVLKAAAADGVPLMVFVGNAGCVQIHSGPVVRIEVMGPWLNVLDPRFNLHLREDRIAAAWVVRKPSRRGDVHSLELFDRDGFCFCQIFGERTPGSAERADWRALVTGVAR